MKKKVMTHDSANGASTHETSWSRSKAGTCVSQGEMVGLEHEEYNGAIR